MAEEGKNEKNLTAATQNESEQTKQEASAVEKEPPQAAEEPKKVVEPTKPQGKVKKPYMSNQYMVLPVKSYFWTMILFCIPVLGQLSCLVMALGGSRYRNKIHFARACFIMMVLQAALIGGLYFLAQWAGNSMLDSVNQFLINTGVGYPTDFTQLDQWVKKLQEVPQVHQYLQNLNQQLLP